MKDLGECAAFSLVFYTLLNHRDLCGPEIMPWYLLESKSPLGLPMVAQWLTNLTRIYEVWVQSLALFSGLRIWHCHELWWRSQMQLGSHIAVALV